MKHAICAAAGVLAITTMPLLAAPDSAYQALRTIGTERGNDALQHVIEVDGHGGVPQPTTWHVVMEDASATGGVRTVDISGGKIVAEHTPVGSSAAGGALIDFHKLNLDSAGAFTVAEKEAQKSKIGFDSVDYTLRAGDSGPVWVLHMMDNSKHSIGSLTLAADTGVVVGSDFSETSAPVYAGTKPHTQQPPPDAVATAPDTDNVYAPPSYQAPATATQPPDSNDDDTADTQDTHGLRIGHKIKQGILAVGESLKNFVTGKSSSGN
jgi:hypothetical protein